MATAVIMPRLGNSVENCLIATWKLQKGDSVAEGDIICEVETDKATMEVEAPASGTVLALFFDEGAEVPVLTNIAVIGEPGEDVTSFQPNGAADSASSLVSPVDSQETGAAPSETNSQPKLVPVPVADAPTTSPGVSPRARRLAEAKGIGVAQLSGSGPGGRIIERDVQAALATQQPLTPLAKSLVRDGIIPAVGTGLGGRVTAKDLTAPHEQSPVSTLTAGVTDEVEAIPLKGVRKVIAERMLASLQTTAQLTLSSYADARAMLAYRQRLKASDDSLGLQRITINDFVLLAVSRVLAQHPALNALFEADTIYQYRNVHLAVAVDTPRGLMVPVIRNASTLSLKQISQEAKRLAMSCLEGRISPDELNGGTFTVTNLGAFGIDTFTPVLNLPQVAILGVGSIAPRAVQIEDQVQFIPHLGLSLTINHQVVDGAPAARFLQALSNALATFELLLAG